VKILVTGASGFIGSHVVEAALAAGHRVQALARRPSAADPAGGVKRLVLVSSLAARGPAGAAGPVSLYGRSKLAGEDAARGAAGDMEFVVVRPTIVYGPRDRALVPMFRLAARGLRPVLKGGGVLTVVHGADLARGLVGLIAVPSLPCEPLEVSDGRNYTWEELVGAVALAVGRPGEPWPLPRALFALVALASDGFAALSRRPQMYGREKFKEALGSWPIAGKRFWQVSGLEPRFDLAAGARDTVRAHRAAGWY